MIRADGAIQPGQTDLAGGNTGRDAGFGQGSDSRPHITSDAGGTVPGRDGGTFTRKVGGFPSGVDDPGKAPGGGTTPGGGTAPSGGTAPGG